MDPRRPILLVILPLLILVCGSFLIVWNVKMHKVMNIPMMRSADLVEITKSNHTADILGLVAVDDRDTTKSSNLEKLQVKFRDAETGDSTARKGSRS